MMRIVLLAVIRVYQVAGWPVRHTLMRSWVPTSSATAVVLSAPMGARAAWDAFWRGVGDTKPPRPPLP